MSSPDSSQAYDSLVTVTCRYGDNIASDQVKASEVRDRANQLFVIFCVDESDRKVLLEALQKSVLDDVQNAFRLEEGGQSRQNERIGARLCHCDAQFRGTCKDPAFFPELKCDNQGSLIEVTVGFPLVQAEEDSAGAVTNTASQPVEGVWAGSV